jgi:hypothetical protein
MRERLERGAPLSTYAWYKITRVVALVCIALVIMSYPATAQNRILAPNARVMGDLRRISSLSDTISTATCRDRRCRFRMRPVDLTVSVPSQPLMRVTLDQVQDPRNIVRDESAPVGSDLLKRPLLLRGHAWIRHSDQEGGRVTVPIAATLHRDQEPLVLDVMLPRATRRRSDQSRFVIIRTALGDTLNLSTHGARAEIVSRFAYRKYSCASTVPAPRLPRLDKPRAELHSAAATYDVIYVSTDYDAQYQAATRCTSTTSCKNKILTLTNRAALIFEEQFGVTVEVATQYGPTRYTSSRDSFTLLSAFSTSNDRYRGGDIHDGVNSGANLIDIRQLFTGRSMNNNVIGLAFLEVACLNDSSSAADMLVQRVADSFDPITTAHELGHTLSATHTSSGIMSAALGYPLPTQFNPESVVQISSYLQDTYGECRGGTSFGAARPQTLRLSARKQGRSSYTIQARVSRVQEGCRVRIRAASNSGAAPAGALVSQFTPSEAVTRLRALVDASITASSTTEGYVYLFADYVCPSGQTLEVSRPARLAPNVGTRSPKRVTRTQWIRLLNRAV